MDDRKTALERAFELARSGSFETVTDLKKTLLHEGYSANQVQGQFLQKQLRTLIVAAKKAAMLTGPE